MILRDFFYKISACQDLPPIPFPRRWFAIPQRDITAHRIERRIFQPLLSWIQKNGLPATSLLRNQKPWCHRIKGRHGLQPGGYGTQDTKQIDSADNREPGDSNPAPPNTYRTLCPAASVMRHRQPRQGLQDYLPTCSYRDGSHGPGLL